MRSIKEECLSRVFQIGQGMVRRALREYVEHNHTERNHQGIGNALITLPVDAVPETGPITHRSRLGGVLNCYNRLAA